MITLRQIKTAVVPPMNCAPSCIEIERREESGRSFATDELVPATITRSSVEELNMELQNNIDFTCIMGTLSFFS